LQIQIMRYKLNVKCAKWIGNMEFEIVPLY